MASGIPDRWSVGLDERTSDGFMPDALNAKTIKTIAVQYDLFGTGGAERVTREQLCILKGLGFRVILYTNAAPAPGDLQTPEGIERRILPSENYDHEERYAFWEREVETEGIDACIYNSWVSGWMQFDCWALTRMGVRFVLYCHNMFTSWFGDDTADYLSRAFPWVAKRCAAIICINSATASFFKLMTDRVLLFANPLDSYLADVDATRNPTGKTIVWVGRMSAEKRPEDLIPIMERVLDSHPDAHMVVVGAYNGPGDPQPDTLRAKACSLGLGDSIEFVGFDNPYPYYAKADVYLLTSEYEGFCMSLAEAMYFGLPCVTYDMDYQTMLKDNDGAVLVPFCDYDAAAEAISAILSDSEKARVMGERTRETYERVASVDFANVYGELISSIETGKLPESILFGADGDALDESKMCRYFLQGVRLACSERHRLKWECHRLEKELARLEKELAESRMKTEEVLGSRTYKLGNALVTPLRAIRDHGRANSAKDTPSALEVPENLRIGAELYGGKAAPILSIIIPIYNVEEYLAECLESVAEQSFGDFEAICVIDGSTDGSEAIARRFCERDKRFKMIVKENGGLSSARNAGIDVANGGILMFVDSDDVLLPDACKVVVSAFAAHIGAVEIVTFGAECFPDSPEYEWYHDVLSPRDIFFEKFDPDLVFVERSRPFVWRTAIASSFFKRTHLRFDETVRFGEDQIFQFSAYPRAFGVALISDKLYRYRMNRNNSLMAERGADSLLKLYEHLVIADRICQDWTNAGYFSRYRCEMRKWSADFLWWNMFAEPIENQAALLEPTQEYWRRWFGPQAGFPVSKENPFEALCAFLIEGSSDALSTEYANARDAWLESIKPDTSLLGRARSVGVETLSRLIPGARERLHPRN